MNLAPPPDFAEALICAFARIGAMMMLMPGLGERSIPARQRLVLALALTLTVLPVVREAMAHAGPVPAIQRIIGEALLGLAIGTCGRLILTTLETAGALISQAIGLSFAQVIDPTQGQQGEIISTFLRMAGVALIFAADLHHLAIAGMVGSYETLPLGVALPTADLAALILRIVSETFRAGAGIAAPFIVFGLVFNVGLGLAARLAPQLQLFFLAIPVSIALGIGALALVLAGTAHRFIELARSLLTAIFAGG